MLEIWGFFKITSDQATNANTVKGEERQETVSKQSMF